MIKTFKGVIELDQANKYLEFTTTDMTSLRVQAEIITSDKSWGAGVLRFYGSVNGEIFHEIDNSKTLTAAGILSSSLDISGTYKVRVVVATAGTSGAQVQIFATASNPYR